ncbi:hypothetical protein DLREEDagrD3_27320 [Denitratisoma sp. agr-D3]
MALIPTDVGVNLRTQVDSPLRPTAPVSEIPSDLPALEKGQTFTARIVEVLPEATYKALVAGKSITLSLPGGAKAGDTLELVVVDKTPRMVMAKLADAGAGLASQEGEAYPHTTFSAAAQLIGKLLPAEGEAARPVALNQGEPLLPTPPQAGDEQLAQQLAPRLEKAVSQSGMFYEAHQAKWVAGQLPTEALLDEPQNQLLRPTPASAGDTTPTEKPGGLLQMLLGRGNASEQAGPAENAKSHAAAAVANAATSASAGTENADRASQASATTQATTPPPAQVVPDELRHLVQQQLDAAATQRMVWHGEVWPQQPMDWEIQRDGSRRQGDDEAEGDKWTTRLALTTPRLGRVEATLELRPQGVHINLQSPAGQSLEDLQAAIPRLSSALEAAGVPALSIRVWQRTSSEDGGE